MATLAQQRMTQQAADASAAAIEAKRAQAEYFITDPNMKNIGNVRLKPGQKTVVLSADAAKMFLGQGLDTVSPQDRAKQRAEDEEKAEQERAEHDAAEAKRIEAAEKAAAKAQDGDGASAGTSAAQAAAKAASAQDKPKQAGR